MIWVVRYARARARNRSWRSHPRKALSQRLHQFRMEDYLAVLDLYSALTLKLAHDLRDRFAGRGDHVRQVLMRQAHAEERSSSVGFADAIAQRPGARAE